ncbi:hypothetical protein Emag_004867 [Eimeria magna]
MLQGGAFVSLLGSQDRGSRMMPLWSLHRRTTKQSASDHPAFTWSRGCMAWRGYQGATRLLFLWGCFCLAFVCVTDGWKARPRRCSAVGVEVPLAALRFAARGVPCTASAGRLRSLDQGTLNWQRSRTLTELRRPPLDSGLRGGRLSTSQPTALASLESSTSDLQHDAPVGCIPDCDEVTDGGKQEAVQSTTRLNATSKEERGVLGPSVAPSEDWHSKRQRQKQVGPHLHLGKRRASRLWELTLTSLRAGLRQSLHSSTLDVSEAVLLQKAGGPAAVRRDILRFTAEALTRKARVLHNARILGRLEFEEDLNALADRLSPGSPLSVRLCGEAYPKVTFKRPYKGLKLKVRKQPYAKGALFRATEDYLLFKHAETVDYPDPQPFASEGDTLLLRVDQGWFEEPDGTLGPEIPGEYIRGQTTLHLVRPWFVSSSFPSHPSSHTASLCSRLRLNLRSSRRDFAFLGVSKIKSEGVCFCAGFLTNCWSPWKAWQQESVERPFLNAPEEKELKHELTHEKDEVSVDGKEESNAWDEEQARPSPHRLTLCDGALVRIVWVHFLLPPDDFFAQICGMTRAQLWDEIEASAESLITQVASKYALGAAAAALDEITQADIPESLLDLQAKATWSQQLKVRKLQGEDNSKIDGPEAFSKWKEDNRRSVENILKTAYAIQAVCKKEGLEVNERELQLELGKAMLQAPTESMEVLAKQLYKKAQARLVYDFIVKHADIEFFTDETPAEVSVETDGERKAQQGVKAFPKGTNLEEWQRKCQEMKRERDSLRDTARRFFVDAKSLRKYDKKNDL